MDICSCVTMHDVMKKRYIVTAVLALALTGCSQAPKKAEKEDLYSNVSTDAGFDTVFYYQEYNADRSAAEEHFQEAVSMFSHYNALFDIYNDYEGIHNIKMINDNVGKQAVEVEEDVIEMLEEAKHFYTISDDEFDVTMGSLLHVWHNYREDGISLNADGKKGKVPGEEELKNAAAHRGWDAVEIDDEKNEVFIKDPSISLDVGGIAKGFAVEKIAEALTAKDDIGTVILNAGGNNRTIGVKPNGTPWKVRIQNPDGGSRMIIVSAEGSSSFVTSGDYERNYEAEDGKKYHHIIDPETLFPASLYRSVTVITKDSGAADCLSTSLFTLTIEEGKKLLAEYEKESGDSANAVWIMPGDSEMHGDHEREHMGFKVAYTDGLQDKISFESGI